jgi:hypothetical protein
LEKQDWDAWFKLPQEERDAIKRERRRNAQRASAAAASAKLKAMGGALYWRGRIFMCVFMMFLFAQQRTRL